MKMSHVASPNIPTRALCKEIREHPFNTLALLGRLGCAFPPEHPLNRLIEFLEGYEDTLFTKYTMDTKDIRSILGYEEMLPNYSLQNLHLTPEQAKLLSLSSLSTPNTHTPHRHMWDRVASIFVAYRLVDIFATYPEQVSLAPLPAMALNKIMPKTLTQEMANGLKVMDKLLDWPNVLRSARRAVENTVSNPKKDLLPTNQNKTWTLLGSVARRNTPPMFDKVADNLQMAALHYTVMTEMRGVQNDGSVLPDLPENLNTLISAYGQDDLESVTRITEFLSHTTASHLRIPLHIALMVSPILLLINYQLHKTRCDRISLLIIQKALGNGRPPALKEIELEIFQTLLRVSQNMDVTTELVRLVNSAKWRQCEALPATNPACHFFRPLLLSNNVTLQSQLRDDETAQPPLQDTANLCAASFQSDGISPRLVDGTPFNSGMEIGSSPTIDVLVAENADSTKPTVLDNLLEQQCGVSISRKVGSVGMIDGLEENVANVDLDVFDASPLNSGVKETRDEVSAGKSHGNEMMPQDDAVGEEVVASVDQLTTDLDVTSEVDAGRAASCVEEIHRPANPDEQDGASADEIQETNILETADSSADLPPVPKDLQFGGIVIASGVEEAVDNPSEDTPLEDDNMSIDEADPEIQGEGREITSSFTDSIGTAARKSKTAKSFLSTVDKTLTERKRGKGKSLTSKNKRYSPEKAKPPPKKPPVKRKRKSKNQVQSKVEKEGQEPIEKSSNPEAEGGETLYTDVDIWNPMAISLDVDEEPPKLYGSEITTYSAFGEKVEFRPCAHDQHTLNIIDVLWSQIKSKYVNDKPEFLSNPEDSCIAILRIEDMASYTDYDLLQILKKKHVVTIGEGNPPKTFRNALRALGSIATVRTIQDQSIPSHDNYNERCQKGTLKQLLQASQSKNGKILNALDIPLPATAPFASPFSSDVNALFATQGSWKTNFALSIGDVRWGLAATTGAFHTWHIDSNGFATFILPLSGSKWWILARPKSSDSREFFDINLFVDGRFDLDKACDNLWTLEAILLVPGTRLYMRPNTPHAVYTPESAVVDGGHFYPSVALEDTLVGIIHSFIAGGLVTNTNHGPARFHLQQLIAFFHSAFVQNIYEPDDPCLDHIPDYRTKDGYSNIIALCIYGVLMNVLDYDTYRHPQQLKTHMTDVQEQEWMEWDRNALSVEQRKACMYARGQCLQIMDWLSQRITAVHIRKRQGSEMQTEARPLAASVYQERLLVAYCHMAYAYKQLAERKGVHGAPTCDQRLLKVQLDGVLSGKLNQSIKEGILDDQSYERYQEDHVITLIEVRECRTSQAHQEVDPDPNVLITLGMSVRDVLYERGQAIKHEHSESDFASSSPAKKRRRNG